MFTFLSLITHDQVDNDYFKYNSNSEDSKNLLGFFGAVVSGFLYDIFGHISYLIPIFLVANSFNLIIGKGLFWYNWFFLPLLLIFASILTELISINYLQNFFDGGLLGIGLYNYLSYYLDDFWHPPLLLILVTFITCTIFFFQ